MNIKTESPKQSQKKIFDYIEKCINEGKFNDAKTVIKNYEKIEKHNSDLYSLKAVIEMIEGNLKDAEILILKGLILNIKNFDLLYNLARLYEFKKEYIKALDFYNYAALYCTDNNLRKEIVHTVAGIQNNEGGVIEKITYNNYAENRGFIEELLKNLLRKISDVGYDYLDYNQDNVCIYNVKDKNYISDNIEEFMNLYESITNEKLKSNLIDIICNKILEETESFFVEDVSFNKKIIKLKNNKKEMYIGSKYYDEKDVNSFLEQLGDVEKKDIIIVFGLAFGDHILALLSKFKEINKIIIIEPKIDIFNLFKKSKNYNKLMDTEKVNIYSHNDKQLESILSGIYKSSFKVKLACYANYVKVFKGEFDEFSDKLKSCFNVNFKLQPEGFDYKLKKFMAKEKIEVLVTGISYAAFGFYPPFMSGEVFNFALPNQDLYYDYEIAKFVMNFKQVKEHLKYVIISLCYYSFDADLSRFRFNAGIVHRYIEVIKKTHNYDNLKGIEMLHQIYKQMYSIDDYYNNDYAVALQRTTSTTDIEMAKYLSEKQSSSNFPDTVVENEQILEKYLNILESNGVKPIVVVCPSSKLFTDYYSDQSRDRFYKSINKIRKKHEFQLLDYFYSEKFDESDYYDGIHLNIKGAKKFTTIVQDDIVW